MNTILENGYDRTHNLPSDVAVYYQPTEGSDYILVATFFMQNDVGRFGYVNALTDYFHRRHERTAWVYLGFGDSYDTSLELGYVQSGGTII